MPQRDRHENRESFGCRLSRRFRPLTPQLRTFWARIGMSQVDPGCVKTPVPRPSAQQLNPEGNVGESLLRLRPTSRINISSRSPKYSFHTAWVKSGLPAPCPFTSAIGGEADIIRAKADIQTTQDLRAWLSVSASLWFGGLRPRYA